MRPMTRTPSPLAIEHVKKLHGHLIVTGLYTHPHPISKVFAFYALSPPHLTHAHLLFLQLHQPTSFFFNLIIRAFSSSASPHQSIHLYHRMLADGLRPDRLTFPFALKACSAQRAIHLGRTIHCHSVKLGCASDVYVSNALIHFYASAGDTALARGVFDEMAVRDLVSWNSLICAYGQCKRPREVLGFFEEMVAEGVEADKVTMVKVVSACTQLGEWELAETMVKYIEDRLIEVDVYLGNTLIDYFGRRGDVVAAKRVFNSMKGKNIVTMNAMIAACSKAGDLVSARRIFDSVPEKDLISWSSMITGYSQASRFNDALALFRGMQLAKVKPDEIVVVSVLSACAHLGSLSLGKWVHDYIRQNNIKADVYVGNSLIDMYSKCGSIMEAVKVFGEMTEKDITTWNSTIVGLATNGYVESALEVFRDMLAEGCQPNDVTFLGVLIACAHCGLVYKGLEHFKSMREVYGVEPQMKHYGCVVDLLSRCGELDKAFEFIEEMPMEPDPVIWRILLGGCKEHGHVLLAEIVIKKLHELDCGNSGNYVLLSNTYTTMDRWKDAMKVRESMAETDVKKIPGCSAVEVSNFAIDSESNASAFRTSTKEQAVIA